MDFRQDPAKRLRFSRRVRLRRGSNGRTILGRRYRPGLSYAPDDPGVLERPMHFVIDDEDLPGGHHIDEMREAIQRAGAVSLAESRGEPLPDEEPDEIPRSHADDLSELDTPAGDIEELT